MMKLLAINMPTYERLESFSAVINELEAEINALDHAFREMVEVNVYDNNSIIADKKRELCEAICARSGIEIGFKINEINIGGDRNIYRCCSANKDAVFTWVLGDDDHLVSGSLKNILEVLLEEKETLGLMMIKDGTYFTNPLLSSAKYFRSYYEFAKIAVSVQPHILIAHGLISGNIFRTSIFHCEEALYVIDTLTPRLGLIGNLPHMRGIIGGLLRQKKDYYVIISKFVALNTELRLPVHDKNVEVKLSNQIRMYYFYYIWLLSELGIRVDQVKRDASMWWLFKTTSLEYIISWVKTNIKKILKSLIHDLV